MTFLKALGSYISNVMGVSGRMLVITDLTLMSADEVCIAGVDGDGKCIRPVTPSGVKRHQLFQRGRLAVYPRAKILFDLSPAPIAPPHIEGQRFNPGSIAIQGICSDSEWEAILQKTCFPSVAEMFDGNLDGGRRVPTGAQTRSLGTIGDGRIIRVGIDDSFGSRQFRLDFADPSGKEYRRFPINDLAFRTYFQKTIEILGEREAESVVLQALLSTKRIYLRIGLARPETLGDHPEACWTQVTGTYTLPDYLEGKTFADF